MGLDGLVITEHYHQWRDDELALLQARAGDAHFVLLSGFEYGSRQGDLLIYGLSCADANNFPRGLEPEDAINLARKQGGTVIAAHPTRGVDVGAQAAIWDLLRAARRDGLAVLLISADLDELIGLSDSIKVILRGRIVADADPQHVTPEQLGSAMTGAGGQ